MNKVDFKSRVVFVLVSFLLLLSYQDNEGQAQKELKREYIDEVGRKVVTYGIPKRIVSLAPSITETLFALGLENEIVGVTNYCDFPEAAKLKTKIGGIINPNYEVIVSLKPDLAIATTGGNIKEAVEKISSLGIPVYALNAQTVEGTFKSIRHVGEITGKRQEAEKLVEKLDQRVRAVRERIKNLPPKKVLFLVWYDPIIVPGKNSFISDALSVAGAEPVAADAKDAYRRYSLEQIVIEKPDYILMAKTGHALSVNLEKEPGWQAIPAVINQRIYFIYESIQHPSPRLIDAIEEVAKILFPEVFNDNRKETKP